MTKQDALEEEPFPPQSSQSGNHKKAVVPTECTEKKTGVPSEVNGRL